MQRRDLDEKETQDKINWTSANQKPIPRVYIEKFGTIRGCKKLKRVLPSEVLCMKFNFM